MNKKIVKILAVLIQKMLNDKDIWNKQEQIITELEDMGYTIENISEAYDILLNEKVLLNDHDFYIDYKMTTSYNRVFTKIENFYFNKEIKGIIYKLNSLEILTADQFEVIIFRMMQLASVDELKTNLIWNIISEVIDDSDLLITISAEIDDFDSEFLKQQRVN